DVVDFFMALLSFADSTPRAYRLKVSNACPPISTLTGTSPTTDYTPVSLDDNNFDIGAYIEVARQLNSDSICFLNTTSEILADHWLYKLASNLSAPGVGLVGATSSFESMRSADIAFPSFPNPHIRSNAFMISRKLFCTVTHDVRITDKLSTHNFESGSQGLTRKILSMGLRPILVGRNGRGYSIENWATSGTFRQARQENLLVADNQTRLFANLPFFEKSRLAAMAWGRFLQRNSFATQPKVPH
ncbi:hypothetical protein, partial [Bacillus sp. DC4300-2b2]|uniref:hypothetical protein n=1 Tax=Bacillus sp. DC4300-2b2 TaxID=2809038 RepID=UPI003CE889D5